MKSLSRDELMSLLEVAKRHNERDWLMILTTFNHGLRVSETLSLTRGNLIDRHLVVQRLKGSRKTVQPLLPSERDALLDLASKTEHQLFPICRKTFWSKMKVYGAEAGIPSFKATCHTLKHTAGRLGFKAGMGIPELVAYLGHKNPANSLIYAQASEQEAAEAFGAAFGGIQ